VWALARARLPDNSAGWTGAAAALREQQRPDAAEALLAEAVERFAGEPQPLVEYARLASQRAAWPEAAARWALLRERFPGHPMGYLWGARALRESGQEADADALLGAAVARLPGHAELAVEHAWSASRRRDWPQAARRWQAVRERFGHVAEGYSLGAAALRELGRHDEAEQIYAAAVARFPQDAGALIGHAKQAATRGDWATSVRRYELAVTRCPSYPAAHQGLAQALAGAGRLDDADRALGAAALRFPADFGVQLDYARLATRRQAWPQAFERWEDAQRLVPGDARLAERLAEARQQLLDSDPMAAEAMAPDAPEARAQMRRILLDFESLGGALHGCEFGLVQRKFQAEPLGLLRWTEITADELIPALQTRLHGVGLPENTNLKTSQEGERFEYITYDTRFGMRMHTFTYTDQVAEAEMLRKSCQRLQYLARKLLTDIANAEKIFVFKMSAGNLPDAEVARLHQALRAIGPAVLLYVGYADARHPNGSVELAAPGLLRGYIDRFAFSRAGEPLGPATESWVRLSRKAHALWQATRG
jgi:tetratricopeptide (TPR) repeat protein